VLTSYGKTYGSSAAVPEPSAVALLLAAMAGALAFARLAESPFAPRK
jgi:hypothetical protein